MQSSDYVSFDCSYTLTSQVPSYYIPKSTFGPYYLKNDKIRLTSPIHHMIFAWLFLLSFPFVLSRKPNAWNLIYHIRPCLHFASEKQIRHWTGPRRPIFLKQWIHVISELLNGIHYDVKRKDFGWTPFHLLCSFSQWHLVVKHHLIHHLHYNSPQTVRP